MSYRRKYLPAITAVLLLLPHSQPGHAQLPEPEEIVAKANQIIKNIYNDMWRLRDRYAGLRDFGPDNYSDTPEMAFPYQAIKSIRIKSKKSDAAIGVVKQTAFRGDADITYVCFSQGRTAFASVTKPTLAVKVPEIGLYLLVYINVDDKFFKRDMINIIKRNATVVEQISY